MVRYFSRLKCRLMPYLYRMAVEAHETGAPMLRPMLTEISESIQPATIIFATLPILVVYPFVQRYFVKGVTIGAVKG